MRFALGTAALLCAACPPSPASAPADDPELARGMLALCRAEVTSGAVAAFPYGDKGEALEAWLAEHLTDPELHALYYETVLQSPVHHQQRVLEEAAAEVGISPCPLAAYLGFLAAMPIEATTDEACLSACLERNRGLSGSLAEDCAAGCGAPSSTRD